MHEKTLEINFYRDKSGIYIVKLSGKMDIFTFKLGKDFLSDISEDLEGINVVVDLREMKYIASSGWSILISRSKTISRAKGKFVLFGMSPEIYRIYKSMKLKGLVTSFMSEQEALDYCKEVKSDD